MATLLSTYLLCAQAQDVEKQRAFLYFWSDSCLSGSGLGSDLDIYVTGVTGETAGKPDGRPNRLAASAIVLIVPATCSTLFFLLMLLPCVVFIISMLFTLPWAFPNVNTLI